MHAMHINEIDLNLLRVFEAVYRVRNVSRAAETLGLTQPAVSHALTLFVRAGGGVQPTAKASQLAESGLPEERRVGAPPLRTDER